MKTVKAKITRVATEIVICRIDKDENVEEVMEVCDELDYEVQEVHTIIDVIS